MIEPRRILLNQGILTALCAATLFFTSRGQTAAFLCGGALSAINFLLLSRLWISVLDKKPVATSLLIIVTKYAILGGLLYVFIRKLKLQAIPLVTGLSTLVAAILMSVLQKNVSERRNKNAL
jgi:hypothetical protein